MTFEVEVNGHIRSVSVERAGSPDCFRVTIDGESTLVDAQRSGEFGLSLLFAEQSHRALRVALAPGSAPGELLAYLSGRTVPIVVNGRRTGRAAADTGAEGTGEAKVIRPMPR